MLYFANEAKFTKTLEEFGELLGIEARLVIKRIAFELFVGVVKKTPVDTGWARANWTISANKINYNLVEKVDVVEAQSIEDNNQYMNESMEIEAMEIEANRQAMSEAVRQSGEVWFIANSVQYIFWLEAGSSPQMDKGYMIERTMHEVTSNIENLMKDVTKANGGNLPQV